MSNEDFSNPALNWGQGYEKPPARKQSRRREDHTIRPPSPSSYVRPEEALQGLGRALRENPELSRQLREALRPSSPLQDEAAP